jgi:hypothetical protein
MGKQGSKGDEIFDSGFRRANANQSKIRTGAFGPAKAVDQKNQ